MKSRLISVNTLAARFLKNGLLRVSEEEEDEESLSGFVINVNDKFKQGGKEKGERREGQRNREEEKRRRISPDELVSPLSAARPLIYESANLRVFALASLPTPSMTAK